MTSYTDMNFISNVVKPLEIEQIKNTRLNQLSGGELQKVMIILCLGNTSADIYLIDEPSAHLDIDKRLKLTKIIRNHILSLKKCAFIIEHGFGEAFKKRLPECLLLLDAAPFLEDVEACNQNEIQRQVKLGIIPFGKTGNPRKDIHADNIWNANYQRRIALREKNININI